MAVFDNLFHKYRELNKDKSLNSVAQQDNGSGKFGQNALHKNPNLNIFDNAQNNIAQIIDGRSVVSRFKTQTQIASPENYFSSLFAGIHALPLHTNKSERIRQYRAMAQYTECDFCLTEIADDFLHHDEEGNFIKLIIPEDKTHLNDNKRKIIQQEFNRFVELFHFRDESFRYIKRFLTDGELAFENIINREKPELGIIGIKELPAEYFETLLDANTGHQIGILFDKEKMEKDLKTIVSSSFIGSRAIFNNMITTQTNINNNKEGCIPILYPQITYFSSGDTSPDGLITFPLIEKCKQSYHQLALMQDAAVILRVTRAPERLLFNISTDGMNEKMARSKIREMMEELKSKKVVSAIGQDGQPTNGQDITQVYNPVTMLETYFSGKTKESGGTSIESVGSTADFEQIADIEFFLRRLFKQFKVPFSRYKTPENALEKDESITYEEYSLARQELRIQRRIASGLKRSFITDLKLLNLWKNYKLKESDFYIEFTAPVLYDLYQQQKMITAKMDSYKQIVDQEELSKTLAMKKILHMTDEDIEENFKALIKEKQQVAIADYYADMVSDDHKPLDYKSPIRLQGVDEEPNDNGGGDENGGGDNGEGGEQVDSEEIPPTEQSGENAEESSSEESENTESPTEEGGNEGEVPTFK